MSRGISAENRSDSKIQGGRVSTVKNPEKKGDGRRQAEPAKGRKPAKPDAGKAPEWTQSLRQLYDSVVDEPLPESFKTLLEELDKRR